MPIIVFSSDLFKIIHQALIPFGCFLQQYSCLIGIFDAMNDGQVMIQTSATSGRCLAGRNLKQ
jgi:hypothetical protein